MTHSSSSYEANAAEQEDWPQNDGPSAANELHLGEVNDDGATATLSESQDVLTDAATSGTGILEEEIRVSQPAGIDVSDLQTSQARTLTDPESSNDVLPVDHNSESGAKVHNLDPASEAPFRAKVVSWAIALGMLPVLGVGTVTYFTGQSIQQQISQAQQTGTNETEQTIRQQLPTLLIGTGITAILAGAIAAWLAHRVTTPVLRAAQVSNQMLNKIRPGLVKQDGVDADVLSQLEHNIRSIETYIPALLEQQDTEIEQLQMLKFVTNKIRTSLNEEDVLSTTVEEARKILRADRVIVYGFDEDWYGTIIAESVVPGLSKTLWAEIRDPCFAENYVEKYQAGRVQAIDNIYEAGLTDCHLAQLKPFEVKANLVVPILREQKLFGLLIAHQCSQPRAWQEVEVNFFSQVASQVGFALDHARLLEQVDQINQTARVYSAQASQDYEVLQQRISRLSVESDEVVELFGSDANAAITKTRDQMHEIAESADRIHLILNEITQTQEQAQVATQDSQSVMAETVHHLQSLHQLVDAVDQSVQPLQQPTQQLGELINLMGHIVSQVQLQAMNAALESARVGSAGQSFAEIAEKIHGLSRQLDATLTDVKPLVSHVQTTAQTAVSDVAAGKNTLASDTQLLDNTQTKLDSLNGLQQRLLDLIQQVSATTTNQIELSISGHQTLDNLAYTTLSATEQSSKIADAVHQLIASVNTEPHSEKDYLT